MNDTTPVPLASRPAHGLVFAVDSLLAHLSQLTDPRQPRGRRYTLVTLLALLILAKLGGEDEMKGMAEWVRLRGPSLITLLKLKRTSLPHQTTYERVLARLDAEAVEQVVGDFFAQQIAGQRIVTLDGKVLCGTIPEGQTQGVHLLAAYAPEHGVVLMQVEVPAKAHEITAAPRVLERLDLRDCVVTGDALFTQRELCQQSVQADGDYVFPVKANQSALQGAIADLFAPVTVGAGHSTVHLPESYAQTLDCGHGRIEQRYLTVSSQLNAYLDWPQVGQVFRLQRVVQSTKSGKLTYEVVFGVTSLTADVCSGHRLLDIIRQHWHIENRLHYVRDVSFREDACRIRSPKRQRILACLNNLVIGLIRQTDFAFVPDARRFFAVHYDQALALLL